MKIRKELQLPPIGRTKATPAPLAVSPHRQVNQHGAIAIESRNGHLVATMTHFGPKGHATAKEIVRRYNAYDELIALLIEARDSIYKTNVQPGGWRKAAEKFIGK